MVKALRCDLFFLLIVAALSQLVTCYYQKISIWNLMETKRWGVEINTAVNDDKRTAHLFVFCKRWKSKHITKDIIKKQWL